MQKASRFIFRDYIADHNTSTISFRYAIEFADKKTDEYVEVLHIPGVTTEMWGSVPETLVDQVLKNLHLALGMSYWKMHCAKEISLEGSELTQKEADFWNTVYTKGMGEFFYRNKIDFRGLVNFPVNKNVMPPKATVFPRSPKSLVPIGGGKDSVVTIELLKKASIDFDLFSLKPSIVQGRMAKISKHTLITLEDKLDPKMISLSAHGEVFNGHIPITVVYMFTGMLTALLFDYRYVVFSNEQSASSGNVKYLGMEVNHQWSKSIEFELAFKEYVRSFITPSLEIFSILRPMSEIEIVRRFTSYPEYFRTFSSCNRNFTISTKQPDKGEDRAYWCGKCPKCAFVFLCLTAFLPKETVIDIFGKNLYADKTLIPLFSELLGLEKFKPFECVGTPEEVAVAMNRAYITHAYDGEPVMNLFQERVLPGLSNIGIMERKVLSLDSLETIPEIFRPILS